MFRNEAPYLVEWIEYHRLIGANHFWLFDNESTDDWNKILASYISEGVVEVFSWPTIQQPGGYRERQETQMAALREGLRRARGHVEWAALIDVDEFLLPMCDKTAVKCVKRHFRHASGIYVNWRMFGTSGVIVPAGRPILPRLTACSLRSHPENCIGKSLVRPDEVSIDEAWYPHHFPLRSGAKYVDGGKNELAFDERRDLKKEHRHFDAYLRINHYNLRDERFFRTRRLGDVEKGVSTKNLDRLLEHHDSFGKAEDRVILDFLKSYHRRAYDRFWR